MKYAVSKRKTSSKKKKATFTKVWMTIILLVAVVDLQFSYVLAWYEKEIAETLAVAIVTEIIGCFLGYLCKSYFETKEEKKNELIEKQMEGESEG